MEIALFTDVTEPELLQKFMRRDDPSIRKWQREVYEPMVEAREVTDYTSLVKSEHLQVLKVALELDRESGLRLATEFFRRIFGVQQVIEVKLADGRLIDDVENMDGLLYCATVAVGQFDLEDSRLLVPRRILQQESVEKVLSVMAHELWHAHQYDVMVRWLKENDGLLDLEKNDPKDKRLKGALYALNYEGYIFPCTSRLEAYARQRVEAEAELVRMEILRLF